MFVGKIEELKKEHPNMLVSKKQKNNNTTEKIEKIYLNADGGSWIKGWKTSIHGITTVLDKYHINKELTKMASHLWDSKEDANDTLRSIIRNGTKWKTL